MILTSPGAPNHDISRSHLTVESEALARSDTVRPVAVRRPRLLVPVMAPPHEHIGAVRIIGGVVETIARVNERTNYVVLRVECPALVVAYRTIHEKL